MEGLASGSRSVKRLTKATITVLIAVIIFFAVFGTIMYKVGVKCEGKYKIDRCYVESYYTSGIKRYSLTNSFDVLNKGDYAEIEFDIPKGIYTIFPNPVLRFDYYNCAVKVFDEKENLVYSDGWEDLAYSLPEDFIGNRTCTLPLFTKTYNLSGQRIKVYMYSVSDRSMSRFEGTIIRSEDAWKIPIDGHQALFVFLTTIVCVSSLLTLYSLTKSIANKTLDIGISIFLMSFSIALWSMGTQRMIGVVVQNKDMCAKCEYYALYMLSVSVALFGFSFFRSGLFRKIWGMILAGTGAFFLGACIIQIFSKTTNIQDFTSFVVIMIVLEVIFFAVGANIDNTKKGAVSTVIVRCGVLVMALLALAELIRYFLVEYVDSPLVRVQFGAYTAVVLTAIMLTYYIILTMEAQTTIIERQQLEDIAYKDTLTGIPNRSFFNKRLDELSKGEFKEFTMVFADLNDLKKANDVYGHETGDRLIKAMAGSMSKAFEDKGIFCRWGGDEFVAFVPGDRKLGDNCVSVLRKSIDDMNAKQDFPFNVTAAIGVVYSTHDEPMDPNAAVREADIKMYEAKKIMKAVAI